MKENQEALVSWGCDLEKKYAFVSGGESSCFYIFLKKTYITELIEVQLWSNLGGREGCFMSCSVKQD